MSERRQLVLGFCFTPSVYASEEELEAYYLASVRPFVSLAYGYSDIHFTLTFSGPLLVWLQARHPESMAALSEMLKRRQIEILGGGFFSPLLPLIPSGDRLGQIEELTTTIRKLLGKRPRGLWLTKTVWDPSLVSTIAASGLEFTFVDEREFQRLGVGGIDQPRLTEYQGRLLVIFPHHSRLSMEVSRGEMDNVLSRFREPLNNATSMVSLFLSFDHRAEAEVFFGSPQGFERLLGLVRGEYPLLEVVTASQCLKRYPGALERSYFTGTSYTELCERLGSEPPEQASLQSWKQFLAHDRSANSLYNKMVYVNLLVSSLRGDKYKKKSAYEDLWKSQTSTAFLPSRTGGDQTLERKRAFASLLNAEILLRDKSSFASALSSQDFDLDGVKEYLFQGQKFNFYIDPVGGQVFEWDCLSRPWNYVDVSPDRAHAEVFVDRFFRIDQPMTDAAVFFQKEYRAVDLNREQKTFQLVVTDQLEGLHGRQPLRIRKAFHFEEERLDVDYEIELLAGPDWEGWFSSELHLNFSDPVSVTRVTDRNSDGVTQVTLTDPVKRLAHRWSWPYRATLAEGLPLLPRWWMVLHPGESWQCRITLELISEA